MTKPATTATRASRRSPVLLAGTMAATLSLGGPAAWAATGPTSPAVASASAREAALRIQAQELAGQIQADGRNLDRLAEAVDGAQLRSQQLDGRLAALQQQMARTNAQSDAARAALKEQALLAYLAGGAPIISYLPDHPGADPSLTVSYAEIVSHGQQRAVSAYRAVLAAQSQQSRDLSQEKAQVALTLEELQADRAAASQAVAARQQTLAQVKGQLAVEVAQVQQAQQQAERAAVEAELAQRGDLPPPSAALTSAPRIARQTSESAPSGTVAPPTSRAAPSSPSTNATPAPTAPPTTSPPTTVPPPPPSGGNVAARGSGIAVHYAYEQIGKPYQWGGAGPHSFDCSGLTMMAWAAAGVSLPHLAQGQYDMTKHIPLSYVLPGDLIFFGTPDNVYHVGIYIGGGEMIDAPSTGQDVSISSIYWTDLLGAGRIVD